MSLDKLDWQVDAIRAQTTVLRKWTGDVDPSDRAELADVFAQLQATLFEAHATLGAERQRYRDLFELAPVAYLVTDPSGMILEANHAAAELFGAPSWLLVGKALAAFVAEQTVPMTFFTELMRCTST